MPLPTGEGVLRHLAEKRGMADRVRVASAGTHDYHVGEPPDSRTLKHASKRGYDFSSQRAAKLDTQDFHDFDYILAMDRGHLRILKSMQPHGSKAKLGLSSRRAQWNGRGRPLTRTTGRRRLRARARHGGGAAIDGSIASRPSSIPGASKLHGVR